MATCNGAAPKDTQNASIPIEISIRGKLQKLAPLYASCSIYRVPERLRCLHPDVYTPKVVSIGPLHHGKESLQDMEEHKYRYLQHFLDRTGESLEFCIQKIRYQEASLRSYYAETIKFSSDDFVNIILVDSAFIIELLLNYSRDVVDSPDRIITAPKMIHDIRPDLLLLENQLPFFILEDLYNPDKVNRNSCMSNRRKSEKLSLIQLSCNFFQQNLKEIGGDYKLEKVNSFEVKGVHLLDIVRNLVLPQERLVRRTCNAIAFLAPSITELHQAGVKLKVRLSRNLFGIRFKDGLLEIPKLIITDSLELIVRNLVAFEQCHYPNNVIADYLYLMHCFVNTPRDVELLVEYGIVTNVLGNSREACSLINSFCKGLVGDYTDMLFVSLFEDLHKHCKRPWNKWKANLRQNYLNSPWAIVSAVVAVCLIILTITQTVCSLLSVKK